MRLFRTYFLPLSQTLTENWLRVSGNAEAAHMAEGVRQQRHILDGRSEQCVEPRCRAWDGQRRDGRMFCPCAHGALASFPACDVKPMHPFSPTITIGSNDLQNLQPVLRKWALCRTFSLQAQPGKLALS